MTTKLEFSIRPTTSADYAATENVTREAFWNVYEPGADEHYLLHIMRSSDGFVPELDLVATIDGEIVGNIVCERSKIETDDGAEIEILSLGPVSVIPEFKGRGIGSRLIEEVKNRAESLGYDAIMLFGDPRYYSRLGFVPAETLGIRTSDDMYADPLQGIELHKGALRGKSGRYRENDIYGGDDQAVAEFDKQFSLKEEVEDLPSQLRFQELLAAKRPRHTPNAVELREITTDEMLSKCLTLKVSESQQKFVNSPAESLALAWFHYQDTQPYAIYFDDKMVGFVLLYFDEEDDSAEIWQFMIDQKYQRRGLGTLAMSRLLERIYLDYPTKIPIILSLFPENNAATKFYTKCGFQLTGETNGKEVIMEYQGAAVA